MTVRRLFVATALALAIPQTAFMQGAQTIPSSAQAFTRVYPVDTPGLKPPVMIRSAQMTYTPEAMRARIQGTAELVITVGADGGVRDAMVTKSLDAKTGMDDSAVAAAAKWFYQPGILDGKPVAVRLTLSLSANLH